MVSPSAPAKGNDDGLTLEGDVGGVGGEAWLGLLTGDVLDPLPDLSSGFKADTLSEFGLDTLVLDALASFLFSFFCLLTSSSSLC